MNTEISQPNIILIRFCPLL